MISLRLPALALALAAAATTVLASEAGKTDYVESQKYSSVGRPVKRGFQDDGTYNITFIHVNDVHAHLDTFRHTGVDCPEDNVANNISCYGGYARLLTKINEIKASVNDSIVLNAGDEWQGTLFYSYYGGDKIRETLNQVPFDAMTVGNHEFDAGDEKLASFLANLTFPTIATNIKTNYTPLAQQLVPYLEFPQHELAIVALTTTTVPDISSPGPGTTFEPYETVQAVVDGLLDGSVGNGTTRRVIALTHIGYEEDIKFAQASRNIHLIIGGHSHTPLGGDPQYSQGPYPTLATNLAGEEVAVVSAYRWGENLGRIDAAFEPDSGKIRAYTGEAIVMTEDIVQDAALQAQVEEWRVPFEAYAAVVVGTTETVLDKDTCYDMECTLGNAVTDSMVWWRTRVGATVDGAFHNAGGIRATISGPEVSQGSVLTAFPFANQLVDVTYDGQRWWDIFEGVVSGVNLENVTTREIQVSKEIKYTWNPNATVGTRLISLEFNGTAVDPTRRYVLTTLDFLSTGGDAIIPYAPTAAPAALGSQSDVFAAFVEEFSPLNYSVEGRIVQTTETVQQLTSTAAGGANASTGGTSANTTESATGGGTSGSSLTIKAGLPGLSALAAGALFLGLAL